MSYANLLLNVLYHIVMEMKIRESCLQSGTFIYKPGISVTKQDFHLQMGSLGLQMGFSGYYLPYDIKKDWVTEIIHSAVDVHVDTKNKKIIYTQIIDRESMEMNMKYRVYQVDFHGKNKKILCKNVTAMYINEFEENGIKYEYLINEKPYKSIEKELYWN